METVCKALVLSSRDFSENDKLAVVLTDTAGKLRVKLRGVKKADARLKFAAQPFCFMDAVIHTRGEYSTLITAAPLELFYGIVTDLERMYAGCVVLECADALTRYNANAELLPVALKGLERLCYDEGTSLAAIVGKFLSGALAAAGYSLRLDACVRCGKAVTEGGAAFDLAEGGVKCASCATDRDRSIRPGTLAALRAAAALDYPDLESGGVKAESWKAALNVYNRLIELNFFRKLNAISEFIKI